MKLIYQHLLGFFIVILINVSIIGYSEIKYESTQSYENNYRQMEGYAASLGSTARAQSRNGTAYLSERFLNQLAFVLRDQQVNIAVFDARGAQVYPKSAVPVKLTSSVMNTLAKRKEIRIANSRTSPMHPNRTAAFTGVLAPWLYNSKMMGSIWIGSRVTNVERPIQLAKRNLLNALIISILVAVLFSILVSYYQTSKIKRLSFATKQVAHGNFDIQIPHQYSDEIDNLARNFDEMVRKLKRSDEEIKIQEKRRDQFLADAAHEMRTPLTTINGLLEGLQYDVIPEGDKPKSIELMRHETNRLIRLVNENLDYEKIRQNKVHLLRSDFNAYNFLDDIRDQLSGNAQKAGNELLLRIPKNMPTYADPDRFTQIMVNLIQNAVQFTHNGTILITGKRLAHASEFQVIDNGIGMNAQQKRYIFERFFKADPSRARLGQGESGLGLAIVASLVKQHGGAIKVDSIPKQGSTFTVVLFDKGYELMKPATD